MLQLAFFLFGALHSVTLLPIYAAASLVLVGLMGVRVGGIADLRTSRLAWFAIFVLSYLLLNQMLHGWTGHLIDLRFYRSQGKPIYMLLIAITLSLMPLAVLRKAIPWAAIGFVVGALASEAIFVVVFKAMALTAELTVNLHNVAAAFLAQVLIFSCAGYVTSDRKLRRLGCVVAGVCAAVLFALMDSRGLTISVAAALIVIFILTRNKTTRLSRYFASRVGGPIFLLCIFVTGVFLIGKSDRWNNLAEDRNVLSRIEIWRHAGAQIHEGLIFGGGLGSVSWLGGETTDVGVPLLMAKIKGGTAAWNVIGSEVGAAGLHAHNVVLQILAESGLIGFVLWVLFLSTAWICALRLWLRRWEIGMGDVRVWYALAVLGLFVELVTVGMSEGFSLMSPSSAFMLYILAPLLEKESRNLAVSQPTIGRPAYQYSIAT